MFNLYLIINLIVVFVGLFMIEGGDLGGHPNFSWIPYLIYLFIFLISYRFLGNKSEMLWKKITFNQIVLNGPTSSNIEGISRKIKVRIFIALLILLVIVFTFFNGLVVLQGGMNKGEFRSQMGYFGFLLAIPIKFLFPAFFTRICFDYFNNIRIKGKANFDLWFYMFIAMSILLGLANGDKSMTVTTLLCGFIGLFWARTKFKHVFYFGIAGLALLIAGTFLFDANVESGNLSEAIDYIKFRTFALTAESAWKIWDLYLNNLLVFNYPITLANIFGSGGIEYLFGVGKFDSDAYMYNFAKQITVLLYPQYKDLVNLGLWNITPSAYVEGLVIGGLFGVILVGVFAGFIVSKIKALISKSIYNFQYAKASALIVYFVYGFMPWFQSGGVTTLIHPITIVGTYLSYLMIRYFERISFN